jgi:hypothetical protein
MASDWGWNPGSFEAIGTVAAFVVGFVALAATFRQQNQLRDDDRARHARMVSVQLLQTEQREGSSHRRYTIVITNSGLLPIQNLKPVVGGVWIHPRQLGQSLFGPGVVAQADNTQQALPFLPWLWRSTAMRDLGWGAVAPGGQATVSMLLDVSTVSWRKDHIGVTFTDAEGRRWTRRLDGTLRGGTMVFGPRR